MESRSRDIGRKTGLPGLSASALNSIENAEQKPTLDTLLALSTLYGISPGQLFAWIEEERGADEPQPHAGAATASADPAEEPESILQMARSLRESGNLRVAAALLEGLPGLSGLPAGCALLAEADLLAAEVAVDRAEEALQRGDAPRARHHAEQAARVALRARPVLGSLGRSERLGAR